jgi:meiotic recombination protein SPO11
MFNCSANFTQSQYYDTSIQTVREIKENQIREKIISSCENLFNNILNKLLNEEKLEIFIIDLDKNSKFNYDCGYYSLELSKIASDCLECGEKIKYFILNLYDDSERLAKLLRLCKILYAKSLNNNLMTKRELYYNDVELFKNTINIDNSLQDICSIFNISRFELGVFPAQKGLFAGDLIIYDSTGNMLNNSTSFDKINLISFEYYFEEISIQTTAKFILVVEKESIFFNILGNKIYENNFMNSIIVTGKGFPDYLTKYFIKKLVKLTNLPIFYFGDFDPSGIEIYFNYIFGCKTSSRENYIMTIINIKWIGLSYKMIQDLMKLKGENHLQIIKLDERDIKKIENILTKEYFNLDAWTLSINPYSQLIITNLENLMEQFEMMKMLNYKAEGELLISLDMELFVEYLKIYLSYSLIY